MDREAHLAGLRRLIDPAETDRLSRAFATEKSRQRWLKRLAHGVEMHPSYATEPPRGGRDEESLLAALTALGAPESCYVIASDHGLDDSFQPLRDVLTERYAEFGHGTILSCRPGELALFKTAWPHRSFIVHRP